MSKWEKVSLGDLVKIKGGKRLPKGSFLQTVPNAHPYIRVRDMGLRYLPSEGLEYVPDDVFPAIKNYIVNTNDVIMSIVGSIGLISVVDDKFENASLTENCVKLSGLDHDDALYLYYYLSSEVGQYEIHKGTIGAVQAKLPLYNIAKLSISWPEKNQRKAIASILSSLDDKIALNREMNKTLEAMAQAIFKSWFVDFEPFRDGEFVESELGMIPKGWEVKPLPELIELNPKYSLKKGSEASYLDMANIPTDNARVNEVVIREFSSGSKFMNGDTLLARITPSLENGKTAFVDFLEEDEIGWGSTEFIVMRAKNPLPKEFTYFLARTDDFRNFAISNMSGTSGRQRVPNDCFEQYLMILPDVDTCKKFGEFASSVIKKMQGNDLESRTLSTLRDTLLPKLLSGEIEVSI